MLNLKEKKDILIEYGFENDLNNIDNYFITDDKKLFTPVIKDGELIKTGEQVYNEWLELQNNPPKSEPSIEEIDVDKITILIENQKQQDSLLVDNAYRIAILELNTNNVL
ncbi:MULTISPECIES: hypothetical protein [unclassified Clostridioides]|uniref:hypothetical protein n=1 Tax=unclassified Clostridioides TaxID=2635829 RepID=UPI001D1269F4|nr:hypothetical protein [Clostridioides sp. ZZV15-6388]MCC0660418.1 hypothetical protein [Clostridioides sp. ZZV14-6154]MCC0719708.1 hypothetical protein [Clostridioides sp. ZZV14-6105]MCC0720780.1 hypothetical protein [Clostridioides sp. ZZV14-6104]MCC0741411.1 hypothetical protein [Clostridioides sp. ZZV14-6044]MCC0750106.1 hypothetical protein [Clostridioides sp. ZZV13-5731]